MRIQRIGPEDWRVARLVRLDALAGSAPGTFSTSHTEALTWDEPHWREWAARRDPFFVAGSDAQPAGSAGVILTPDGPELVSMWTAPRARRTGVSDRLVRAVIDWATQAGHPSLRLWVLDGNRPAEQLYLRTGFAPTGASRPCAEDDPRPENEMILPLPAD
ncbi:GNAT family N-acetyltransferase [Nocardia rhamnosiphila]|uniref:GNAT family N-acetyltransferase n=1 Tax=Nocardia rhamnosiphila TaxID=426716 RepID=A0ABV2WZX9_9NOCA|nr:GNAT family N-acetyltransferase [Nocardia rhamnosiphila]